MQGRAATGIHHDYRYRCHRHINRLCIFVAFDNLRVPTTLGRAHLDLLNLTGAVLYLGLRRFSEAFAGLGMVVLTKKPCNLRCPRRCPRNVPEALPGLPQALYGIKKSLSVSSGFPQVVCRPQKTSRPDWSSALFGFRGWGWAPNLWVSIPANFSNIIGSSQKHRVFNT